MKIFPNDKLITKLAKLVSENDLSIKLNNAICGINFNPVFLENPKEVIDYAKKNYEGEINEEVENIILMSYMLNCLLDNYDDEIFRSEEEREYIVYNLIQFAKVFDVSEISENPYFKNIQFNNIKQGNIEFKKFKIRAYELFIYDMPKRIPKSFISIPPVGFFKKDFYYPGICENDIPWMTISPNEIYTMKEPISKAFGNVLTLGCGLGYFAYMTSLKEKVSSITIVEKNSDIIELFKNYILPQFEHKNKIKLIQADAFEYMKNYKDGEFDFCFADIWQNVTEENTYYTLKNICRNIKKTKMSYWIEDSFITNFRGVLGLIFFKEFADKMNLDSEKDLPPFDKDEKRMVNYVTKLYETNPISKPEHIEDMLINKNILKKINSTNIDY